ncbi:uncharacterized protein A4U43_C04F27320 [Asparagus officinalis]|uniref:C2H2-type domain-containing protein n=1 Tax=Asparagus officinalis TaxID=4686 RepID=A0A5P1F3Y6_ASPOF|nr:uncharacterized protein A4U43_C04F27320 [Asparagus officinalis]
MVHSAANYTLPKGMFECKACKKVFTSHQALGGHRASHKKVKGCFAAKLDDIDDPPIKDDTAIGNEQNQDVLAMAIVPFNNVPLAVTPLKKKSKVHECSICHRQFASGQALGGHKRCHWITSNSGHDPNPMAKPHHHPQTHQEENNRIGTNHELTLRPMFDASETLDLNLPARHDIGSPLTLDVPTALYLQQPWVDQKKKGVATSGVKDKKEIDNENGGGCSVTNKTDDYIMEDEIDSKVKLAKLSELKDMNVGEESPWLQVGIGSSEKPRDCIFRPKKVVNKIDLSHEG